MSEPSPEPPAQSTIPAQQPAPQAATPVQPARGPRLFVGARRRWKFSLLFTLLSFAFLGIQIWYQQQIDPLSAVVRGAGLAAATFVSFALLCSIAFKFRPAWARFWPVRRSFGVLAFVFALIHALQVTLVYYLGDVGFMLSSANPFQLVILLGLFAFAILSVLFFTSTDWAVSKLGTKWKALHRLVYFAYVALVAHYLLLGTNLMTSPPGLLLLAATVLALAGQLFWFLRTRARIGWKGRGALVGYLLIVLWLFVLYVGFIAPLLAK